MGWRGSSDVQHALRTTGLVLAAALALFSWLSPNHYLPWTGFHGQLAMAGAAVLVALCAFASPWRAAADRVPYLALVALVAALVPWFQFAAGVIFFSGDALMASLYLLAFALAQTVGYRIVALRGSRALFEPLAWLFVAASLLSMWIALYQWQGLRYLDVFALEVPAGSPPFANLSQPNLLATLLVLGLVGCAYVYQLGRIGKLVAMLLTVMFVFGIAMTQSRAGLLQLLIIGGWLAIQARGSRLSLRSIGLAAVVLLACIIAWSHLLTVSGVVTGRSIDAVASVGRRPAHWLTMLDAATRHPWFGYGWNQITVAQYAVAPDHPATREILAESHNLILDLLVWNGLPLGLLFAGAIGLWFLVMLTRRQSPESAIALAAVIAVFAHSMVEFPIYYLMFMLPIAAMMGGLAAELQPAASLGIPRWAAPLLLGVLVWVGASVSLEYLRIEADLLAVRFEQSILGRNQPRATPVNAFWLTQHSEFLRLVRAPERDNLSREEIVRIGEVAMRYPSWSVLSRYASVLAKNNRGAEAAAVLSRICKTHPEAVCRQAQDQWRQLGATNAKIAAVPFSAPDKPQAEKPAPPV